MSCDFSLPDAASEDLHLFHQSNGNDYPVSARTAAAHTSILKKRVCSNEKCDRDMIDRRVRWDPSARDKPKRSNLRGIISWIEPIITPIATFICMKYLLYG